MLSPALPRFPMTVGLREIPTVYKGKLLLCSSPLVYAQEIQQPSKLKVAGSNPAGVAISFAKIQWSLRRRAEIYPPAVALRNRRRSRH
jgi:hypothetical protein